jgi:hypothetical protein
MAAGGRGVLARAEWALEQGLPAFAAWRGVEIAEGGQGGHIHRSIALKAQLQVAAVQQRVEATHGDLQHHQGGEAAGRQGPALREQGTAVTLQKLGGHPAAWAGEDRR